MVNWCIHDRVLLVPDLKLVELQEDTTRRHVVHVSDEARITKASDDVLATGSCPDIENLV